MAIVDVTDQVETAEYYEGDILLSKCICGKGEPEFDGPIISQIAEEPSRCRHCGRRYYWDRIITVYEVTP